MNTDALLANANLFIKLAQTEGAEQAVNYILSQNGYDNKLIQFKIEPTTSVGVDGLDVVFYFNPTYFNGTNADAGDALSKIDAGLRAQKYVTFVNITSEWMTKQMYTNPIS